MKFETDRIAIYISSADGPIEEVTWKFKGRDDEYPLGFLNSTDGNFTLSVDEDMFHKYPDGHILLEINHLAFMRMVHLIGDDIIDICGYHSYGEFCAPIRTFVKNIIYTKKVDGTALINITNLGGSYYA